MKQRPVWWRFERRYFYGLGNSNFKKVARAAKTTQEASRRIARYSERERDQGGAGEVFKEVLWFGWG